ncbi:MFS transporter [Vagococcus martis]|uniref:MFS transporter n=1 Tax=Vagococcus martis TaxID=1768210 RepID=A0A1V4DEJ8_9ENTE|nr:MFS transporter [Vagococcus martis]OPF86841.1 MFS transporter [Vagococcus martis]
MKNKYMPTAIGLYINYFVHGMGVIILAQNMDALASQWGTDNAGVAIVISSLGIGRLIVLMVSGYLSDKFGRRPFVLLGMLTYILFFIGILVSPSIAVAYIFGILAGVANSFLDSGTYPALMESFPESPGTANVIIKAFISAGQFALPLMVGFIVSQNLWYGWTFVLSIAIFIINGIYLYNKPFPKQQAEQVDDIVEEKEPRKIFSIEGVAFILYGYVSQATFYLVSQWLTKYGSDVANMGDTSSRALISYYSVGSLLCVFVTSALVKKKFQPVTFLVGYTFISFVALLIMWLFPTALVCTIGAFVVGFSAAGGVMQLGLTVMADMFPSGKGKVTGIFYTAGSIASFTIPLVTGQLSKTNVANIILLDVGIALLGFLLAIVIFIRFKKDRRSL